MLLGESERVKNQIKGDYLHCHLQLMMVQEKNANENAKWRVFMISRNCTQPDKSRASQTALDNSSFNNAGLVQTYRIKLAIGCMGREQRYTL